MQEEYTDTKGWFIRTIIDESDHECLKQKNPKEVQEYLHHGCFEFTSMYWSDKYIAEIEMKEFLHNQVMQVKAFVHKSNRNPTAQNNLEDYLENYKRLFWFKPTSQAFLDLRSEATMMARTLRDLYTHTFFSDTPENHAASLFWEVTSPEDLANRFEKIYCIKQ